MNTNAGRRDPLRWVRRGCDGAVRVAVVAAALCPALASLGGGIVAALLVATRWCVDRYSPAGIPRGRTTDAPLL